MKKQFLSGFVAMLLTLPSFALLTTPSMVAPSHGAVSQAVNVMLDWGTSTGATYYEYKLSTSPSLAGATASSTGTNSYFYTSELKFNTTYYWSVRARSATDSSDWSVIYMFTTMDGVSLVSPSSGSTGQAVDVMLDWSTVSGITYYDVEIDTSASFASPLHQLIPVSSSYSYYYTSNLLFGQKYYWRVRARHSTDTTSWSTVWNFTTHNLVSLVSPTSGSTGQAVDVMLDWSTVSGITYYDVEIDTTASFSSPLHQLVPVSSSYSYYYTSNLLFNQKYYWRVRARHATDTTSWSSVWNFTTHNNISQVAPSNNSTGQAVDVMLDWSTVSGITYYDVEIDTTASFSSPLHQLVPVSSSYSYYYTSNLLFNQKYYWRVRARHATDTTSWSSVWNFTTHNNISQVAPSNNSTGQAVDVMLDWSTVSGITYYDVEIDTSASFTSPLHQLVPVSSSYSYYYTSNLLFGQKYYWRVRARHATDTTSWSSVWNFTTHNSTTLYSPSNGAVLQPLSVTLDWNAVSGITYYDVEYDTTAAFNSPLHQIQSTLTGYSSYTASNLLFGTTYYWRARSRHSADTSTWSSVWNFTTMDAMGLTTPSNGATNQAVNVTLDWDAVTGITHYDVEYDTTSAFNSPLHQIQTTLTGYSNYTPGNLLYATTYYWRARSRHSSDTSSWSVIWSFTTTDGKPVHVSPANTATNVSLNPTIDWNTVAGTTAYQYEYSADPTFSVATPTSTGTTSQAGLINLSYGQTYYWRVRACHTADTSDWSTPWSFTTLYQLTTPVILSSPANGTTGIGTSTVSMTWQTYATAVFYEYMYADNSSFTNAVTGSAVSTSQITSTLLPGTTYYWKVRANNGSGYSPWSDVWTFSTSGLAMPVLLSPSNGATGQVLSLTLDWQDAASAAFYEYQLDDDVMFGSPAASGSPTVSQASVSGLSYGTTYYWRVRTSDGTNYSAWCTQWSFTTGTLLAPALTSPSNGATDQALSLTLDWQDATFAVSYEYQLDDDIAFGSPFVSGSPSLSQAALSGLSYATTYYWRVRSYDGVNYSAWSTIWSFTTGTLTAPSLISPANGASNQVVNNLILDWGDVTGASLYEYYYDTDISFSNPVHAVVTVSQVSISGLSNNTSYFWKVRSSDGTTYSPFTSVWSFTTETGVGFEENSKLSVLLYPNPASESSTLEFGDAADRTVCIVNSTGMVVNEIRTTESKLDLDLSGLNPGVYMIIVRDSKETKTLRLIRK